jgi:hypothetical protein
MTIDTTSQAVAATQAESFIVDAGLADNKLTGSSVSGHIELGAARPTHWSIVHGGVYCIVIAATVSLGASAVVEDRRIFAVGHTNQHALPAFHHFRTRRCRRRGAQSGPHPATVADGQHRRHGTAGRTHGEVSLQEVETPQHKSPERPHDSSGGSTHPAPERQEPELTGIDGPAPGAAYRILLADHGHGHHRKEIPMTGPLSPNRFIGSLKEAASWPGAHPSTAVILATALAAARADEEGSRYFQDLSERNPADAIAQPLAGFLQVRAGHDVAAAISKLDKAATMDVGLPQYFRGLALAELLPGGGAPEAESVATDRERADQVIADLELVLAVRDQFPVL